MLFKKLTKLIIKRPKTVVATMLTFMLIAGALGGGVVKKLTSGGFDDTNSDSYKAAQRIEKEFGRTSSNVLVSVTFKEGLVTDEKNVQTATEIENKLRSTEYMSGVFSYWTAGQAPALKGNDNKQALILGTLAGTEDEVAERIKKVTPEFSYENSSVRVGTGGFAEINHQFTATIEKDLRIAEIIALPLTLLILMFVFRSVIAASLPIIVGVFAIMGSLLVLDILTRFTSVSIYALNLTTMLGLGLAIDYSLFIVSRFREHLSKGESVDESVGHAIQKAGKTVLFSALTVAVSLAALLVFPQTFLKSFAFAGVAVALVSALGSIV
ncbi:MMPL family transporter, partial [bacterium]|nr:MMPL family transporter [bacterium]